MDKMAPENVSLPVLFLISTIPPMPHVIHFSFVCCIPYTLATESALKNTLYTLLDIQQGQQGDF